jgi:RHS repeat-associated protein
MNRLQDCFDDDDAGDGFAGQLFQGMRHDPSVPLTDFARRHFSPTLKNWMPADPVAYVDGLNWYNAPPANPINAVDPLGT